MGCALAVAIGIGVVFAVNVGPALITGRGLNLADEWWVFLFQMLIAGSPFGLLALAGIWNRAPWIVGIAMTTAFWGYLFFDGLRYHFSGDTSGANIGLGLFMIVSPVIISAACLITHEARRQDS